MIATFTLLVDFKDNRGVSQTKKHSNISRTAIDLYKKYYTIEYDTPKFLVIDFNSLPLLVI
jgi:hypothetical protein